MGFIENAHAVAAIRHQRQGQDANSSIVGLLTELVVEQKQTNRILGQLLSPDAVERLQAEEQAIEAAAAEAARTAPPEKKKRNWL
jgi:hypothetical protein